jgi:hypothetical protein
MLAAAYDHIRRLPARCRQIHTLSPCSGDWIVRNRDGAAARILHLELDVDAALDGIHDRVLAAGFGQL